MKMWRLAFVGVMAIVALGFGAGVARAEEASSSVPVHVTVVASGVQLFDGDVQAAACDSDGAGTLAFTAYCAVSQAEASSSWSWWGSDAFLDSVNGVTNDNVNGWYWGWFANLVYGETAMNKHSIAAGDRILVLLNTAPLRLTPSTLAPAVGDTVSLLVEEFGYDESWNPVWKPSALSHILIGLTDLETDASGTQALVINSSDPVTLVARKDGNFVSSPSVTIVPVAAPVEVVEPAGNSSGSSVSEVVEKPQFNLDKAVHFLLSFQKANGSFGDEMYTDWATLALKAAVKAGSEAARTGLAKVKEYLIASPLSKSASLTDNERRAMALMAAGVNPYTGTDVDYIKRITDKFDGEQFGDAALENDDIFALIVLLKAGYALDDSMLLKSVDFLVSRQKSSGAWIGVDVTAAAIQALRSFGDAGSAVALAEAYIKAQQEPDGGFGNVYSLSWALQALGGAISGADEALAREQQDDGGFRESSVASDNRLWATAYAIPAALQRSWPELMSSYKKVQPKEEAPVEDDEVEPVVEVVPEVSVPGVAPIVVAPILMPEVKKVESPSTEPVELVETSESVQSAPLTASAIEVTGGGEDFQIPWVPFGFTIVVITGGIFVLRRVF